VRKGGLPGLVYLACDIRAPFGLLDLSHAVSHDYVLIRVVAVSSRVACVAVVAVALIALRAARWKRAVQRAPAGTPAPMIGILVQSGKAPLQAAPIGIVDGGVRVERLRSSRMHNHDALTHSAQRGVGRRDQRPTADGPRSSQAALGGHSLRRPKRTPRDRRRGKKFNKLGAVDAAGRMHMQAPDAAPGVASVN
jgi:hypothetical protein